MQLFNGLYVRFKYKLDEEWNVKNIIMSSLEYSLRELTCKVKFYVLPRYNSYSKLCKLRYTIRLNIVYLQTVMYSSTVQFLHVTSQHQINWH